MSLSMTGLIWRKKLDARRVHTFMDAMGYAPISYVPPCTLMEALSKKFDDIGMLIKPGFILVLDKGLGGKISFGENLLELDNYLIEQSIEGDIFCFDIHGVAESYCYSFFENGQRVGVWCKSGGEIFYDSLHEKYPLLSQDDAKNDESNFFDLLNMAIGGVFADLMINEEKIVYIYRNKNEK